MNLKSPTFLFRARLFAMLDKRKFVLRQRQTIAQSSINRNNCKELIAFYYPQILRKYSEVTDNQLLWELIKMELRARTIGYSKEKRCKLRNKEEALQKELQEIDFKICNGDYFEQDILEKFEADKEELKRLYEIRGKEAMFKSKIKWVEQGEKPTKYFHNLEKTNQEKKLLREVKQENEEKTQHRSTRKLKFLTGKCTLLK